MTASFSNSFQFNEIEDDGAPGETRTRDPLLRRQTLYPTELRAREALILGHLCLAGTLF